jgi:putative protease
MAEQLVGTVTHFFKGPSVAVVKVVEGHVALGDKVRFLGHTSDFTEPITSMEVNHQKVERANVGDEVAIQVVARVRPHDKVFRVVPD